MSGYMDAGMDGLQGAGMGAAFGGPVGAGIGAGAGLLKYYLFDQPRAQKERALAASTQRYSPWTHLTATAPTEPDPFSNALAFGSTGAQIAQGAQNAKAQGAMQDAYLKSLDSQNSMNMSRAPYNFGTSAPSDNFWGSLKSPDQMDALYGRR